MEKIEPTTIGDFLEWARKGKWWLRGFESIQRSKRLNDEGWSFVWTTQCGYVSDEQIHKIVKPKTAREWDRWGR